MYRARSTGRSSWCGSGRVRARPPITTESIAQFSQGKISHHKIPRYVHVVEELPMTVTGKVRKVEMREEALKLLDLER